MKIDNARRKRKQRMINILINTTKQWQGYGNQVHQGCSFLWCRLWMTAVVLIPVQTPVSWKIYLPLLSSPLQNTKNDNQAYKYHINVYKYPNLTLETASAPSWNESPLTFIRRTLNRHIAIWTYFYISLHSILTELSTFDCHDSSPIISLILQSQRAIIRNQLKEIKQIKKAKM